MARCYFGRVLACVWLTSLKGDERDHNVFERVRIHDFTGTLCHPSGLPKVCTETGNFLTVTRDLTSFLGVITEGEYIFPSLQSGLFLLTTSLMVLLICLRRLRNLHFI